VFARLVAGKRCLRRNNTKVKINSKVRCDIKRLAQTDKGTIISRSTSKGVSELNTKSAVGGRLELMMCYDIRSETGCVRRGRVVTFEIVLCSLRRAVTPYLQLFDEGTYG